MEELCAGIKFMNKEHKDFFCRNLLKCRELDIYHMALIYCLGIDRTVREHFENVYDLKAGLIRTESLQEGWQTSGSKRAIRLAFNLYTNGIASVDDYEDEEERLDECRSYAVEEIFCCGYAPYFWQSGCATRNFVDKKTQCYKGWRTEALCLSRHAKYINYSASC